MNYALIAIGYMPEYLKVVINSILSVDKDSKIYIFSDIKSEFKNVTNIHVNDLNSTESEYFKSQNIYENTIFEDNPLWITSILRVFYLKDIINLLKIENFIHFDNDVLIYKPYEEISENFENTKFNITQASEKKFVFGYSYIDKKSPLNKISSSILELVDYGIKHDWKFNNGKPYNEMDFLGAVHKKNNKLINPLPTLPYFSENIFDPSSYGQYLDGTHKQPRKIISGSYVNLNEPIGIELNSKRISCKFKDNKPIVKWKNKNYDLVNLHVHSKRFDKFLPNNYKNFI
tara:strand:+ start:3057 stop:3920 length:864 start_codon:yes stop_codon:yes gene_type:complete